MLRQIAGKAGNRADRQPGLFPHTMATEIERLRLSQFVRFTPNPSSLIRKQVSPWLVLSAIAVALLSTQSLVKAQTNELEKSVGSLQQKYAQIRDLTMDFIQSYRSPRRPMKTETGVLFLKRPGMMRWEYQTPIEKLFVSNGKTVYFYLPEERQVQKTKVKETSDQRIPFLFLLGKGNLKKDFSKIEWATDNRPFFEGNKVIYAYPKKNIDEFAKILMEFNPKTFQLQRVTIFDIDGTTSEFVFTNIKENHGAAAQLFDFRIPPNTEVLDNESSSQ
jgi:outer membrane lipoprotein carrier protein